MYLPFGSFTRDSGASQCWPTFYLPSHFKILEGLLYRDEISGTD